MEKIPQKEKIRERKMKILPQRERERGEHFEREKGMKYWIL